MTGWTLTIPDAIGFLGVAFLVGAYGAQQAGKLSGESPWYSALNGVAALLLVVSLIYKPNPASMTIEVFWFAISAYGFWRAVKTRRARRAAPSEDTADGSASSR